MYHGITPDLSANTTGQSLQTPQDNRPLRERFASEWNTPLQSLMKCVLNGVDPNDVAVCAPIGHHRRTSNGAESFDRKGIVYATRNFIDTLDRDQQHNPLLLHALQALGTISITDLSPRTTNVRAPSHGNFYFIFGNTEYQVKLQFTPKEWAVQNEMEQGEITRLQIYRGVNEEFSHTAIPQATAHSLGRPAHGTNTSNNPRAAGYATQSTSHTPDTTMQQISLQTIATMPADDWFRKSYLKSNTSQSSGGTGSLRNKRSHGEMKGLTPDTQVTNVSEKISRRSSAEDVTSMIERGKRFSVSAEPQEPANNRAESSATAATTSSIQTTSGTSTEVLPVDIFAVLKGRASASELPVHQPGVLNTLRNTSAQNTDACYNALIPQGSELFPGEDAAENDRMHLNKFVACLAAQTPTRTLEDAMENLKAFSQAKDVYITSSKNTVEGKTNSKTQKEIAAFFDRMQQACFYLPSRELVADRLSKYVVPVVEKAMQARLKAAARFDEILATDDTSIANVLADQTGQLYSTYRKRMLRELGDPNTSGMLNDLYDCFALTRKTTG